MHPEPTSNVLYTIGYGARTFDEFLGLLKQYEIDYLIDSRSQPHSRYKREFNRETLAQLMESTGIRYVFMGDVIGGRPADPTCYPNGDLQHRPDYSVVQTKPWFIAGIERLIRGLEQGCRMAIMCAEQKPEVCHRTLLVSEHLQHRNITVMHIDETGQVQSHQQIMQRVTDDQPSLF